MVVSSAVIRFDPLDSRLLSPVFVPGVFSLVAAVDQVLDWARKREGKSLHLPTFAICAGACAWLLLYPGTTLGHEIHANRSSGVGYYNTRSWRESEVIAYVAAQDLPGKLFSNDAQGIYLLADKPCHFWPGATENISRLEHELTAVNFFVWINHSTQSWVSPLDRLQAAYPLVLVARFSDGLVLSLNLTG